MHNNPQVNRIPMSEKSDKPAGKQDLTLTAYNAIRQMLFYNEIHPGQKIKYKDLAGRIGVSMTPVIQSLNMAGIQKYCPA